MARSTSTLARAVTLRNPSLSSRVARDDEAPAGTPYEVSIRRALRDEFHARYAQDLVLDETQMITVGFTRLAEITET